MKPAKVTPWRLASLLAIASLWGMIELTGGDTMVLTVAAILLLAVARVILNLPFSSLAIAGVALLFRSVNAGPFHCHLAGIALLGAAFDASASLLMRGNHLTTLRGALTGGITAFLSPFLFASSMVWVFQYGRWPAGGFDRVVDHVVSDWPTALLAIVVVPIGLWMGRAISNAATRHPHRTFAATASGCTALWIAGVFVG